MSACEINQAAWNHEQDVELCTGPAVKGVKSQHLCHLVLLFRFRFLCVLHCCPLHRAQSCLIVHE